MKKKILKFNQYLKFITIISIIFFHSKCIYTNNNNEKSFIKFKEGIFSFSIEKNIDKKKLIKKISLRKIPKNETLILNIDQSSFKKNIGYKFLVLFQRAQNLLNMYPEKLKNINIRIYSKTEKIYKLTKNINHNKSPAFYNFDTNTIYLSFKKCNEYILAHEMAHAIISNYFVILPPENVQELLATYCDTHLKDNSKTL